MADLFSEGGSSKNKSCRKQEGGGEEMIAEYAKWWVAMLYIMILNIEVAYRQTFGRLPNSSIIQQPMPSLVTSLLYGTTISLLFVSMTCRN